MKQLQSIDNFVDLLDFLRDELDWPIEDYELDDLVFEYDPDELGLKDEEAEKLKGGKIRQLRPLAGGQPFGIFFVEFGKKRLPIVVLRRILSQLVIKKRANAAEAKRWETSDLLFISAYGEEGEREIAFAHFHKEPDSSELPILRVLGWDGSDTPLKLQYVERELKNRLNWPDDTEDQNAWREQWRAAFRHRPGHVIATASALAETLAEFARRIRDAAATIIKHESEEKGHLRRLHRGFRDALIHDLTEADFADTYAQTVTYGLLTAAVSRTDQSGAEGTALSTDNITDMVPVTNPFLKEMLEEFLKAGGRKGGIDFDELGIQDVVELLRDPSRTDLAAVLRDFGNRKPGEDPVIHFYEHFLAAYNKKLRIQRGVFYTPQPVVSYIIRSVHELLQTEFGLKDGLASTETWGEMLQRNKDLKLPPRTDQEGETDTIDPEEPFVQILDPATGTATFPVEVIDVIHKHLQNKWAQSGGLAAMPDLQNLPKDAPAPKTFEAYWQHYVPLGLLPRLHAFELMMAPYAIAHMKVGLKLAETGYRFGTEERARIYLTNALEPKVTQLPQIGFDALAHEAAAVNEIKWYKRFTIIIGNPPYSGHSANNSEWAKLLVADYYHVDGNPLEEKNSKWLQDDYVKFFRLGQYYLVKSSIGVMGLITNHGYIDNPTFRGMRQNLLKSFDTVALYDLHGNANKVEKTPDGNIDKNVFEIRAGVGIMTCTKNPSKQIDPLVSHASLWGTQGHKYATLAQGSMSTTSWQKVYPSSPFYLFIPQDSNLRNQFENWPCVNEVFSISTPGIVTGQDALTIAFDEVEALKLAEAHGLTARAIQKILYRPLDYRFIVYHKSVVTRMRNEVMKHMLAGKNLGLITVRRVPSGKECGYFSASSCLISNGAIRSDNQSIDTLLPLYLYPDTDDEGDNIDLFSERRSNLSAEFTMSLSSLLGFPHEGNHDNAEGAAHEDIFHYAYAVFHSPSYRTRYAEFLKIDFPRLPLTSNLELFRKLACLGCELKSLHILESSKLNDPIIGFIGTDKQVSKVIYTADNGGTVWIDGLGSPKKPQPGTSGFAPVPKEVWNFQVGGYQVCQKWLKDRGSKKGNPGRTLTDEDIAHYQKIIIALTETIRLMAEIDEVIETHGGWPGAFQTEAS